jgi:hypothetical protein
MQMKKNVQVFLKFNYIHTFHHLMEDARFYLFINYITIPENN